MLPSVLRQAVSARTPKLNPLLAKGLATTHLEYVEKYIDDVFRIVASEFPRGITYEGYDRLSPREEIMETINPGKRDPNDRKHKLPYDMARSSLYMVRYKFRMGSGQMIYKPMFLPFVEQAGSIYLSGSRHTISPVLNDRAISVGRDGIFVRVLKAPMNFKKEPYHFRANGLIENVGVVWSELYNGNAENASRKPVRGHSTLGHYLFCKYGLFEAFKKVVGVEPVIGRQELDDEERFPRSDWVVCQSVGQKPRSLKVSVYMGSDVRIAIPRSHYTEDARAMVAAFFYVIDHVPHLADPAYLNNPTQWKLFLGHFLLSGEQTPGKLIAGINNHIQSLDSYLDAITASQLLDEGLRCNDLYDLMAWIIRCYSEWLRTAPDKVVTMYDKELAVLRFVCMDYVKAINNLFFKLSAVTSKPPDEAKDIAHINKFFKPRRIFELNKSHGEVSVTTTSGDNMALKVTNMLVPQTKSTKTPAKKQLSIKDPSIQMHISVMEVGGYNSMSKAAPDGRTRLNLYLDIGPTGMVKRHEDLRERLDHAQAKIVADTPTVKFQ